MTFSDLASKRFSARKYADKKVEKEKLQSVLKTAKIAPTAANKQPFVLIVIETDKGLQKLKKASKTYDAPLAIIVCANHNECWVRAKDSKKSADIDASIVTDHMMMQATELGLGSVWVCNFDPDIVREEFNIPENYEPVNILILGYSAEEPGIRHSQRKNIEDFVINETF